MLSRVLRTSLRLEAARPTGFKGLLSKRVKEDEERDQTKLTSELPLEQSLINMIDQTKRNPRPLIDEAVVIASITKKLQSVTKEYNHSVSDIIDKSVEYTFGPTSKEAREHSSPRSKTPPVFSFSMKAQAVLHKPLPDSTTSAKILVEKTLQLIKLEAEIGSSMRALSIFFRLLDFISNCSRRFSSSSSNPSDQSHALWNVTTREYAYMRFLQQNILAKEVPLSALSDLVDRAVSDLQEGTIGKAVFKELFYEILKSLLVNHRSNLIFDIIEHLESPELDLDEEYLEKLENLFVMELVRSPLKLKQTFYFVFPRYLPPPSVSDPFNSSFRLPFPSELEMRFMDEEEDVEEGEEVRDEPRKVPAILCKAISMALQKTENTEFVALLYLMWKEEFYKHLSPEISATIMRNILSTNMDADIVDTITDGIFSQSSPVQWGPEIYLHAIDALSNAQLFDKAVAVYGELMEKMDPESADDKLVSKMTKVVINFFEKQLEHNESKESQKSLMEGILSYLRSVQPSSHLPVGYLKALNIALSHGFVDQALEVLTDLQQIAASCQHHTISPFLSETSVKRAFDKGLSAVFAEFGRQGDLFGISQVMHSLGLSLKDLKGQKTATTLIDQMAKTGNYEAACELYLMFKKEIHFKPRNLSTRASLLRAFHKRGDFVMASRLFYEWKDELSVFGKEGRMAPSGIPDYELEDGLEEEEEEEVEEPENDQSRMLLFDEEKMKWGANSQSLKRRAKTRLYNAMISMLLEMGHTNEAMDLYFRMKMHAFFEISAPPNGMTYQLLFRHLHGLVEAGDRRRDWCIGTMQLLWDDICKNSHPEESLRDMLSSYPFARLSPSSTIPTTSSLP